MIPEELKYTKEHEWVRIDGSEIEGSSASWDLLNLDESLTAHGTSLDGMETPFLSGFDLSNISSIKLPPTHQQKRIYRACSFFR